MANLFTSKEWKEANEKAKEYLNILDKALDKCEEYEFNMLFTEVTMLRIKLDHYDTPLKNFKDDYKERRMLSKKAVIKFQFEDILEDIKKFNREELEMLNSLMEKADKIVSNYEKPWWEIVWDAICRASKAMQS